MCAFSDAGWSEADTSSTPTGVRQPTEDLTVDLTVDLAHELRASADDRWAQYQANRRQRAITRPMHGAIGLGCSTHGVM